MIERVGFPGILLIIFATLVIFRSIGCSNSDEHMVSVRWFAPFFSGGGYCTEAISVSTALDAFKNQSMIDFSIAHHGDSFNSDFVSGLTDNELKLLLRLSSVSRANLYPDISICHSEPGAWHAPQPRYHTFQCPPYGAKYKIGRTMFETDRIPSGWVDRLNYMDEIWVPTEFSRQIFLDAGVEEAKVFTVGETVDTEYFSPFKTDATSDKIKSARKYLGSASSLHSELSSVMNYLYRKQATVFLFVGKWETRKGIDILLRSYHDAFEENDNVCLLILSAAYHSTDRFEEEIKQFIKKNWSNNAFPCYRVISSIPQSLMSALYSSVNALVIPSHGEGWGRPHVEAMSCGTPVVATNWSGPTEYLTEENGYPLRFNGLVEAEGWKGHLWADPDEKNLRDIMRLIYRDPGSAELKGKRARADMIQFFSPGVLARSLNEHFQRIHSKLLSNPNSRMVTLDATVRVGTADCGTGRKADCNSSPRAPVKCPSAQKASIRRKIQGKALDFNDPAATGSIKSAWSEENFSSVIASPIVASPQIKESMPDVQATPDKALPVIYGSNVTMDSPDPFSKYHEGPGPIISNSSNLNYFNGNLPFSDPETETSTPVKSEHNMPLLYGSNVTMASPDPFSKYHEGPGPVLVGYNYRDEIDEQISSGGGLLPGSNHNNKSLPKGKTDISPVGIADLMDSPRNGEMLTPEKSNDPSFFKTRTGGFGHIIRKDETQSEVKKLVISQKSTIADIRKAIGSTSKIEQIEPMISKPKIRKSLDPIGSLVNPNDNMSGGSDRKTLASLADMPSLSSNAEVTRPSTGNVPNRPASIRGANPVSLSLDSATMRPSQFERPVGGGRPNLVPTPPTAPKASPPTSSKILSEGICGQALSRPNTATSDEAALSIAVPPSRPNSVQRRGRTYVESKEFSPISGLSPNTLAGGDQAAAFPVGNDPPKTERPSTSSSSSSRPTNPNGVALEAVGRAPWNDLVVVGGSCLVGKPDSFGPANYDDMVVTGRPVTAKSNSPAKELVVSVAPTISLSCMIVPKVRITTVSKTASSHSTPTKKKKSARMWPYRPLQQLCSIPEENEISPGVPSWLTVFAGYGIDSKASGYISSAKDKENCMSSANNIRSTSSDNCDNSDSENSSTPTTYYRGDTYSMWMSNQTIALQPPTIVGVQKLVSDIFAAIRSNNFDLIKEKIESCAWTINQRDHVGNSPLIVAVFTGIGKIVRFLIKAGADLNIQNRFGNTALHFSNELQFDKVTNYLIKKGANISLLNKMNMRYDQRLDSKNISEL